MNVDDVFREQYGLISRDQAMTGGLTARQIRYRVTTGRWIECYPGVYQVASTKPRWESRLLAAVLTTSGIASHRCAAALWHLELYTRPRIEVTIPKSRLFRIPSVIVHRTTQWDRADIVERRGIPCTGIERTILDCGAVIGPRGVERLAESAIRQRLTTWPKLAACLLRHSRRGRDGCLPLRRVLEARLLESTVPLSDFSRVVANLLVDNGLPSPEIEYPILDSSGRLVLQVDLAWPQLRKCWELDGLAFHFAREAVERDRRKRNAAKALGWNIQEILWSMYANEPDELVELARTFLAAPSPDSV